MRRNPLATYNAKRDFAKTAEPEGEQRRVTHQSKPAQLRFVIQKHAARHLHFDLRLELDGVFKSWAIAKGPSVNPTDKRLAVAVEDHPLAYGDFEGTIPAGEYGGGTVQLWDRGYWQAQGPQAAVEAFKAGELKFTLMGERLQGSWVLVHMKHNAYGHKENWLLIKHADATTPSNTRQRVIATTALMKLDASVASGRSMAQIAAGEPPAPKPFISTTGETRSKAKPVGRQGKRSAGNAANKKNGDAASNSALVSGKPVARLPEFVEPQLCKLVDTPPSDAGWVHEAKLDGYRLQLRVVDKQVTLKTRKGMDWTHKFPRIAQQAKALPNCIIDGELVALNAAGQPDFAALQVALSAGKTDELVLFVFDVLFLKRADLQGLPLLARKQQLQALLAAHPTADCIRYLEHLSGDAHSMLRSACQLHLEGLISKRADATYIAGERGAWRKTKCRAGHEVVIGGMVVDAGQLRSLWVGVMRANQLVYVGKVGTGFGAALSKRVLPRLRQHLSSVNPFQGATAPRSATNLKWLRPELVADIEFAGWTGGGMVRQAAFKGLREDKPAAEVQAELPVANNSLARPHAARDTTIAKQPSSSNKRTTHKTRNRVASRTGISKSSTAELAGITLSHPDKLLWPGDAQHAAVSKLALAEYFYSVAEWLLKHVRGRPCSIVRAPDGITGDHFFQRHAMAGSPSELKLMKVHGDRKPYLQIDSPQALIAVAQLGGLELHPWNCLPYQPELPGRLVFDLDPAPDVDFSRVVSAALELRQRLQQLKLTSFCKTTGGKGLHVVVPLCESKSASARNLDWPAAKLFAQTLCAQMVSDHPTQYLLTMAKAARSGKIFLDYLRNERMATAVAPLSTRARVGATVSMPLHWTQVRSDLQVTRFTVTTAAAWLNKHQPWADYTQADNRLMTAAKQLLKTHLHAA